jgi:hypothetical protein
VPTLIISGEFDSITPEESASAVAEGLENVFHYTIPGAAHSAIESSMCPLTITFQFLENPNQEPDSSSIPVYHLLEASWQHPTKNRQSHPDLWFEHLNFRLKLSIPALRSELKQLLKGNGRIPKKRLPINSVDREIGQ